MPLEAALLDQPAGTTPPCWVLEDAAERPLRRRLRRLALGEQVGDARLDLRARPGLEPQAHPGRDQRVDEHIAELDAIRTRVHAHAAADSPGNRRGELEAAAVGLACAVEA